MENSKALQARKIKRIQHHQTSFTTNTKGIYLGRKHKRRKRPIENKPKTIKKMVIGNGNPLQYSGLENSMDCIVDGVAKRWT